MELQHRGVLVHSTNTYNDYKIAREHHKVIRDLAKTFHDRVIQTGMVGQERDREALAYWVGAASAFKVTGQTALSEDIAKLGTLEIAPRGYQAIIELLFP